MNSASYRALVTVLFPNLRRSSSTRPKELAYIRLPVTNVSPSSCCSLECLLISLDLSDRFRSLTTSHAQVTGLSSFLELAHWQYQSLLISFAKDLQIAEERYPRSDPFWVDSGLCSAPAQASELFKLIDDFIPAFAATAPSDISELVFSLHGRFLNVLAHLHGEDPRAWPNIPSAPTWDSKHAPFVTTPPVPVPASLPTIPTPGPSSASGKGKAKAIEKGKGRAVDPPLFLEDSLSPVDPELIASPDADPSGPQTSPPPLAYPPNEYDEEDDEEADGDFRP